MRIYNVKTFFFFSKEKKMSAYKGRFWELYFRDNQINEAGEVLRKSGIRVSFSLLEIK